MTHVLKTSINTPQEKERSQQRSHLWQEVQVDGPLVQEDAGQLERLPQVRRRSGDQERRAEHSLQEDPGRCALHNVLRRRSLINRTAPQNNANLFHVASPVIMSTCVIVDGNAMSRRLYCCFSSTFTERPCAQGHPAKF